MSDRNACGNARIDGLALVGRMSSVWDRLAHKFPAVAEHAQDVWLARRSGAVRRVIETDARFQVLRESPLEGPRTEAEWALLASATLVAIGREP